MIKNIKDLVILGLILIFAGFIYTYKLSSIPNGFYVDEAVVAYNAKSILETGNDAFGQPHPVLFRLLGSYTPSLYIYLTAMFIKSIGSSVTVFRLPSVLFAVISVAYFYLIIKKLDLLKSEAGCLIATMFYAISPWLVFNARLGYEVTLAYTLFNIGVYYLLVSLHKPKFYFLSFFLFSLATYTAHTQRFLVPIFCSLFLVLFKKNVFKRSNIKQLLLALVVTVIIQIPHMTVISTPAFWVKNERLFDGSGRLAKNIANQTLSYLSTENLFYKLSDIDLQHTIPEISVAYNWMVVPFLVGVFWMFRRRKERNMKFLLLLFVASLLPAVLSGEFISIQRALPFLLPLMMVIGLGMDKIFDRMSSLLFLVSFTLLLLYSSTLLYRSYFVLFPIERAEGWNYGYDQVAEFIKQNPDDSYLLDNSRNPRNYILLLYYLDYPPEKYQNEVDERYKTDYYKSLPPENSYKFSNIEVRGIDWRRDSYKDQIIIGDPLSISAGQAKDHFLDSIYEVKNPLGNTVFNFYKTDPQKKCSASFSPNCKSM